MAHLTEVVDGGGHHIDAAGAAGRGTGGGAQGSAQGGAQGGAEAPAQTGDTSQGQGGPTEQPQTIQPPPMPSRTSPRINHIQHETIKPFAAEIGTELGLVNKHISSASYRVRKLDKLIPQINKSLAQKHNPSGPVVTSFVNQVMSAIDAIDTIAHKLEEASDNINVNLDLIENF